MQNAIAIAFEARTKGVGVFLDGAVATVVRPSGEVCHCRILGVFTTTPIDEIVTAGAGP